MKEKRDEMLKNVLTNMLTTPVALKEELNMIEFASQISFKSKKENLI